MHKFASWITVLLALVAFLVTGMEASTAYAQSQTLYQRLGGKDAVAAVVDDFVANVAADARINKFFAQTDIARLKKLLNEQLCAATGGGCAYTGRGMKETHMGMGVGDADFNALVEDLVKSLDKFKVPEKEKGELLAILGPLQKDIVEKPALLPKTGDDANHVLNASLAFAAGLVLLAASLFLRKRNVHTG